MGSYAASVLGLFGLGSLTGWSILHTLSATLAGVAGVVLVRLALWWLRGMKLLATVRSEWAPRGVRSLVVYSDSPSWGRHVAEKWRPRLGGTAEYLNWSERSRWDERDLAVRVFRRFVDGERSYNPAIVVFRGLKRPLVFRFFYAFQEAKHGEHLYVPLLEKDCFAALESGTAEPSV